MILSWWVCYRENPLVLQDLYLTFWVFTSGNKHKVWEMVWWAHIWLRSAKAAVWDLCLLTACPLSAKQQWLLEGTVSGGSVALGGRAGVLPPWWVCRAVPWGCALGNCWNPISVHGEGKQPGSGAPSKVLSLFLPGFTPAWLTLH